MPDALHSRRQVLASGAAMATVAAAGCLGVFGDSDSSDGGDSRQLQLTLSYVDGPLNETRVHDADDPPDRWAEGAVDAAIAGESFTTQYRKPFFAEPDDPVYARHDGTYYELGSVVVDEATETYPILRLTLLDDGVDAPDAVDATTLPEGDQRAVGVAHMAARARDNVGGLPVGLVQRGGYVYRSADAVDASHLLADDGPDRVRYRDRVHEVAVARERFHEPVYRATAHTVADSDEGMEAILRAKFVDARISRSSLSADAREIIREASDGEPYEEPHPYSDGYVELLTAMHKRPYLDGNIRKDARREDVGNGMVRYDEEYLEYGLRFLNDAN